MPGSYPTATAQQPSRLEQMRVLAAIHGDVGDGEDDLHWAQARAQVPRARPGQALREAGSRSRSAVAA